MEVWTTVTLVLAASAVSALLTFLITKRRVSKPSRRAEEAILETEVLSKDERAKLELEYRECCDDWRLRDKYVLDKLSAASILFGLLGVALGTIEPEKWGVTLSLLLIGGFFAFILSISVAKDTYYRDGSEKLVRNLASRLGIVSSLKGLKPLVDELDEDENLEFTRKTRIERDKSSLKLPWWLRDGLLNRRTFRWILGFYLMALSVFVVLFVLIVVDKIWQLKLPI